MMIEQIEDGEESEEEPAKTGGLFNSSSKFGGSSKSSKVPAIDTEAVLQAAKDIYKKQQANKGLIEEANKAISESGEDSDSDDEMSFTS